MSKRIDKHVTLPQLSHKLDTILEEINISDKLQFGDATSDGKTENHDEVLAVNRQLRNIKNALGKREKDAVKAKLLTLVEQVVSSANGDIDEAKKLLLSAQHSAPQSTQPDPQVSRPQRPQPTPNQPQRSPQVGPNQPQQ